MPVASPVYATHEYLMSCGVPTKALSKLQPSETSMALAQASREADIQLGCRYNLPLVEWGDDLRQIICMIAAFRLLTFRGWNPDDAVNGGIVMLYRTAMSTLANIAAGRGQLNVVETAPEVDVHVDIYSSPPRGI